MLSILSERIVQKSGHTVLVHLYKLLEDVNECVTTESIPAFGGIREGEEGRLAKGYKETCGVMDMHIILMMGMVSWCMCE